MMAPVKRAAERLVREHWDAIERVAAALSERGELSGDEVDALILPPYPTFKTSKRLNCIPGVGPLLATALVASVGAIARDL
jgi:hypothetical protein